MFPFSLLTYFDKPQPEPSVQAEERSAEITPDYNSGTVTVSQLTMPTSLGGKPVTRKTSESVTAYWRAINYLADAVASLPVKVYQKEGKSRLPLPDHPIQRFLNTPSEILTAYDFSEWSEQQKGYEGNAYAYIVRDGRRRAIEAIPLTSCEPFIASSNGKLYYRIWDKEVNLKAVPASDILHFAGSGINPKTRKGRSPIATHREALGESLTLSELGQAYYANGGGVAMAIKHPGSLTEDQAENLRSSFRTTYGGAAKAGSAVMLEGGMSIESLTNSAKDAMYIEARQFSIEDISRITGVPVHKLSNLSRATFNNIEHMSQEFVTDTLLPIVRRREQELERKLLSPSERGKLQIRYNLDSRLRGDSKARAELYTARFNTASITPNEIREKEDENPIEGGDKRYVPANMIDANLPPTPLQEPETSTDET